MIRRTRSRAAAHAVPAPDRRPARVTAALVALAAALALIALASSARAAPAREAAGVQTIDEISIEGEIRLPRVLFITARQAERPLDFLDHYAVDPAAVLGPLPAPGPIPALAAPVAAPGPSAAIPASVPRSADVPLSPPATPTAQPAEEVRP